MLLSLRKDGEARADELRLDFTATPTKPPRTAMPTVKSTTKHTSKPTSMPTSNQPTSEPSSSAPTSEPSSLPTAQPTVPTTETTGNPTQFPTQSAKIRREWCKTAPFDWDLEAIFNVYSCGMDGSEMDAAKKSVYPIMYRNDDTGKWSSTIQHDRTKIKFPKVDDPEFKYDFNITYFVDTQWGQLCNRMGQLSGIVTDMRASGYGGNALALGRWMTEAISYMDIKAASRNLPALFLNCIECRSSEYEPIDMIRCSKAYVFGRGMLDVSHLILPVTKQYFAVTAFFTLTPGAVGYTPEMAYEFIPNAKLRRAVELAVDVLQKYVMKGDTMVGIHRRFMDGECVHYMENPMAQLDCAINITNPKWKTFAEVFAAFVWKQSPVPDIWNDDAVRMELIRTRPELYHCNYTLDARQMMFFKTEFAEVFDAKPPKKVSVFLADDGQVPSGTLALKRSKAIVDVVELGDAVRNMPTLTEPCFKGNMRSMMADAYALALMPYHMDNPVSSCGSIVTIWRTALGKQRGSSYPTQCYDEFYSEPKK